MQTAGRSPMPEWDDQEDRTSFKLALPDLCCDRKQVPVLFWHLGIIAPTLPTSQFCVRIKGGKLSKKGFAKGKTPKLGVFRTLCLFPFFGRC